MRGCVYKWTQNELLKRLNYDKKLNFLIATGVQPFCCYYLVLPGNKTQFRLCLLGGRTTLYRDNLKFQVFAREANTCKANTC